MQAGATAHARGHGTRYAAPIAVVGRGVCLLLALVPLQLAFLLLCFATEFQHATSMLFYDLAFSIFPAAGVGPGAAHWTRFFAGAYAPAPFVVWPVVALLFGGKTRGAPAAQSLAVGCGLVLAFIAAFRLFFLVMGWRLLVDTL